MTTQHDIHSLLQAQAAFQMAMLNIVNQQFPGN
jgi:hypothetical protein